MTSTNSASYVGVDKRSAPRTDVYTKMPLTLPDGRPVMATVVNISADGLLLRHEAQLDDGGLCVLSMPIIGKLRGTVVWSVGGRTGIQFCEQIDARDYGAILRAMGARVDER